MKRLLLVLCAASLSVSLAGQSTFPTMYITPSEDGFHTYLAAAMHRKEVPVTIMNVPDGVKFTLTAAAIDIHKETTGSKVVKCLFAYCGGTEDKATTAVQLTDGTGVVLWSYTVAKGRGASNRQSMAEAIAKHFKDDYLKKQR
jgi:hypothetical protein